MYEVEFLKGVNDYKKGDVAVISNSWAMNRVKDGCVKILRYTGNGQLETKESCEQKIIKLDYDLVALKNKKRMFEIMLKQIKQEGKNEH